MDFLNVAPFLVVAVLIATQWALASKERGKIVGRLDAIEKSLEHMRDIPQRMAALEAKVDHIDECIHRLDRNIEALRGEK